MIKFEIYLKIEDDKKICVKDPFYYFFIQYIFGFWHISINKVYHVKELKFYLLLKLT